MQKKMQITFSSSKVKEVQSAGPYSPTSGSSESRRLHDESVEAACFDALVETQYGTLEDAALDMCKQLLSYLCDGPPQTPSAIRLLVHEMGDLRGKTVLDLGCGTGDLSVILAKRGGRVIGIDVSAASIDIAQRRARVNNVSGQVKSIVMSAHEMTFPDATFDFVAGKAILHHLDLTRSRDEILRVLKKGGRGYFIEPILFSKAIGLIRRLIPVEADKETPDERQLSVADVENFCNPFHSRMLTELGLISSRLERFFPHCPWWLRMLFRFDFWVLHRFLWLRNYADTMLIIVLKE